MYNKLVIPSCVCNSSLLILCTFLSITASTQDSVVKKPAVVQSLQEFHALVAADSNKRMVELRRIIPSIRYDLRYAGANNFLKKRIYPKATSTTFMRWPAAYALANVQQELKEKGLGLKIFDAYRPYSATVILWESVKDERYAANPAKGSGHNRGTAVDLTLVDLKTGKERDMGTGFDNFTDTAHHAFEGLPEEILQDRALLKTIMEKHGFKALDTEWWHYYWSNPEQFELLDIPFEKLKVEGARFKVKRQ